MRIDDHVNSSHHKKPEYGKKTEHARTRPNFEIPNHQASQHTSVEDVVQLTLSHDGIWEVKPSSAADDPALHSSTQTFPPPLPRVSRLYHSLLHVYSSEGITRALERTQGMLVDVYV